MKQVYKKGERCVVCSQLSTCWAKIARRLCRIIPPSSQLAVFDDADHGAGEDRSVLQYRPMRCWQGHPVLIAALRRLDVALGELTVYGETEAQPP